MNGSAPQDQQHQARYPRPQVNRDYASFYAGIQSRRLVVQECANCGAVQHPPGPMCPRCNGLQWREKECSGKGVLHSYTVHHYPPLEGFPSPHPIALADMEEGFRLVAGLSGVALDDIRIGMPLKLEFPEVEPGYILHRFKPDRGQ